MWNDFYQELFTEKDITYTLENSLEDWDNNVLLQILKYLPGKDIIQEGEGDGYRELASNLPPDANIFVKKYKPSGSNRDSNTDPAYKNLIDYLKFCYNEFGDQGYMYFAVFNIELLKWFMGLKVKSDIKNVRGPLRLDEDLDDYMDKFVKSHRKKIIAVLIDVLASGKLHEKDSKKHYAKLIKRYVENL